MTNVKPIGWGEEAPWFVAPAPINPRFDFSSLAGRFVVLVFFGHSELPGMRDRLGEIAHRISHRSDDHFVMFGVTSRQADWDDSDVKAAFPPSRIFLDDKWEVARSYGTVQQEADSSQARFKPSWFILDPTLRVYSFGELTNTERFLKELSALPRPDRHSGASGEAWAPVLMVPRVLPPSYCRALIDYYRNDDARESGFMRSDGTRTVGMTDPSFKRRKDVQITDERLRQALRMSLVARLLPEVRKAFQYEATRIERYIVACYDSESKGFFRPHRDNTTSGTAHRRFAVTINLNAEEFDGGELRFPEFGMRSYKAPTGGAIVFSCSLLHEALPVTAGIRYATLPFLYGDADAETRQKNSASIVNVPKSA